MIFKYLKIGPLIMDNPDADSGGMRITTPALSVDVPISFRKIDKIILHELDAMFSIMYTGEKEQFSIKIHGSVITPPENHLFQARINVDGYEYKWLSADTSEYKSINGVFLDKKYDLEPDKEHDYGVSLGDVFRAIKQKILPRAIDDARGRIR